MLLYRFPGQTIVSKKGCFKDTQESVLKGFIISDFNNQLKYSFLESEESFTFTLEQQVPFCITKEAYIDQATNLVSLLHSTSLEKLVYSRIKSEKLSISGKTLFERLESAYPNAFVYYFKDPILGEWIGASPEVLIKGTDQSFESMSLAGTKKAEDESPWGAKEIEEQDFVSLFLCFGIAFRWTKNSYCRSARASTHGFSMEVELESSVEHRKGPPSYSGGQWNTKRSCFRLDSVRRKT
jgi:hypothetical protein